MRTLLFQNNVHNTEKIELPGEDKPRAINLTVRKGLKWSNLNIGEQVYLQETPQAPGDITPKTECAPLTVQQATIYDIKTISFADLMNYHSLLKLEQDPHRRTYINLFETMRKIYDGFLQHELVTLVLYELI